MIYEPREDSFLLEKTVKKFAKGKKVLDLGAGSGIIGFACIKAGATEVTFADINDEVISLLNKKGLRAIKTNLFSNIKDKFDLIVFNPPYLPRDKREDKDSALATTGGKCGDEIICKFIEQAPNHLVKKGKILLLISSLTPLGRFVKAYKKSGFSSKLLTREKLFFEELYVLLLEQNSFKPGKSE